MATEVVTLDIQVDIMAPTILIGDIIPMDTMVVVDMSQSSHKIGEILIVDVV